MLSDQAQLWVGSTMVVHQARADPVEVRPTGVGALLEPWSVEAVVEAVNTTKVAHP